MRRNRAVLQRAISNAKGTSAKAVANYNLGLFHDNNSREKEAIPYYRQAIKLGLSRGVEAEARAWLASSLYKTHQPTHALRELRASLRLTRDPKLNALLAGLERRILKSKGPAR